MKKLFAEPLMQFVAIGIGLFVVVQALSPSQLKGRSAFDIVVDSETLIHYLQVRSKRFSADDAAQQFRAMPAGEKETLIEDYVRDQVLLREALALGLDANDEVIRRRLIQKMEYITQGFYGDIPNLSEKDLIRFFEENREDYRVAASVSFTHVFFASDKHGVEQSQRMAQRHLTELNKKAVTFAEAPQYGDRFLFNRNYLEQTAESIRGHFGKDFEDKLFALHPGNHWQGPFRSDYGFHLVLIKAATASRLPALDEVSHLVLADARRQQHRALKKQAVDSLIDKYAITRIADPP